MINDQVLQEQQRIERCDNESSLPIAIIGEHAKEDKERYYCNYCQYNLVKISKRRMVLCNHCKT